MSCSNTNHTEISDKRTGKNAIQVKLSFFCSLNDEQYCSQVMVSSKDLSHNENIKLQMPELKRFKQIKKYKLKKD